MVGACASFSKLSNQIPVCWLEKIAIESAILKESAISPYHLVKEVLQ
jgi:hypothetical protein